MATVSSTNGSGAAPTDYAVNWETAEDRIKDLKEFLLNAPQVMDPERLRFLQEVYEEFRGEAPIYIRAKLFERVLTKKKIFLDGNPLVGTLTGIRAGVYAYPEWNVSWIKDGRNEDSSGNAGFAAGNVQLLARPYLH